MSESSDWLEVESEVYRPGRWLGLFAGTVFLLAGAIWHLAIGNVAPPNAPSWILESGAAVFTVFGTAVLVSATRGIVSPARVRHAAPSVLANVTREPVIRRGSVVHGRLTHELIESAHGWQFRPRPDLWRTDKGFLFGFGIPFLVLASGLLSWIIHRYLASWPLSIFCTIPAIAVSAGTALVVVSMLMRASYRSLCCLSIPRNGDDLQLDSPEEPDRNDPDLIAGLEWILPGETKNVRLLIPIQRIIAVQLCPWKYAVGGPGGKEITWADQGALVLASSPDVPSSCLPILLTSDFVGAARLMQKLADILHVPYLFSPMPTGGRRKRPVREAASRCELAESEAEAVEAVRR